MRRTLSSLVVTAVLTLGFTPSAGLAASTCAGPVVAGYCLVPGANLAGAVFSNVTIGATQLKGVNLSKASFTNVNFISSGLVSFQNANLTDATFDDVRAMVLDFSGANLTNASFKNMRLRAILAKTQLRGVTFTNVRTGPVSGVPASLPTGWKLCKPYLIGPGADLSQATLTGANVSNIDFSQVILTQVVSGGLTGKPAKLPPGWVLKYGYLIGPTADLSDVNMAHWTLTGLNMTGATLHGVKSGSIRGTPISLPTGWILRNGYLIGAGANLSGVDLSGQNFAGMNFTETDFTNANLTGANLSNATISASRIQGAKFANTTLVGLRSGNVQGTPIGLPTGWYDIYGYIVGPGADMSSMYFGGVNFTAFLAGITITGVNFSNSDLQNTTYSNLNLQDTNFTGANLKNANFSNSDLSRANFTGATLTGANLTGVNLSNAVLTGVVSGSIVGTPTQLPDGWTLQNGVLTH